MYLTPLSRPSAVQDTRPSSHSGVYHTTLSRLFLQYLCESSAKILKTSQGTSKGIRRSFLIKKTITQKYRDTVPLKAKEHEIFWSGVFSGIKSPLGPDSNPKTVSLSLANSGSNYGEFRLTFRVKTRESNYFPCLEMWKAINF